MAIASEIRLIHDDGGPRHLFTGSHPDGREMARRVLLLAAELAIREPFIPTRVLRSYRQGDFLWLTCVVRELDQAVSFQAVFNWVNAVGRMKGPRDRQFA